MTVDPGGVGVVHAPIDVTWTSDDVMLYALAVGAGRPDPTRSLQYTTENTEGRPLRVLPAFAALLASRTEPELPGSFDPASALHAGQSFSLARDLPTAGAVRITWTTEDIVDRRKGVLVTNTAVGVDVANGDDLFTATSWSFILGASCGRSEESDATVSTIPDSEPDIRLTFDTSIDQALIYRLTGDRNPLHSDPEVARRVGFDRPILHGMCTFGIAARLLEAEAFSGGPSALVAMSGRFSGPVWPGDSLTVDAWSIGDDEVAFLARRDSGAIVLNHGRARRRD